MVQVMSDLVFTECGEICCKSEKLYFYGKGVVENKNTCNDHLCFFLGILYDYLLVLKLYI